MVSYILQLQKHAKLNSFMSIFRDLFQEICKLTFNF